MFDFAEFKRRFNNLIVITKIVTPNPTKSLATVQLEEGVESVEFPVIGFANGFKKHWIPITKDEQVVVLHPFGDADKGYILRGIFFKGLKEPNGANANTEIIEYSDGAVFSYSVQGSVLNINGVKSINIDGDVKFSGNVTFGGDVNISKNLKVNGIVEAKAVKDAKGSITSRT